MFAPRVLPLLAVGVVACSPVQPEALSGPAPVALAGPARLALELQVEGAPVILDLERKTELLAPDFRAVAVEGDRVIELEVPRTDCFYDGPVRGAGGNGPSWAAISTCDGVRGLLVLDGVGWAVEPGEGADEVLVQPLLREAITPTPSPLTRLPLASPGTSRDALLAPTRYVELPLYADPSFNMLNGTATVQRMLDIANVSDSLYRRGSLSPVLAISVKRTTVFTSALPFTYSTTLTGEVSSSSLLGNFTTWVRTSGSSQVVTGDAQSLLTGLNFNGSTIGLANVASMCTPTGGTVTQHTGSTTAFYGNTLAHELGHTLGMNHDQGATGTACDNRAYVMAAVGCSTCPVPTAFSTCSQADFTTWRTNSGATCLDNLPTVFASPRCGDGIVQPGERCDCGDTNCAVNDPCCNGATCQLVAGATCATLDGCCDQCQVATTARSCRASTGSCDLGSTCNTVTSVCPPSLPRAAGTSCDDGNTATGGTCYLGRCVSFLATCQRVAASGFSVTGVTTCSSQASFNNGNFCGTLYCGTNNSTSNCTSFNTSSGVIRMADGVRCASGSQCVNQACVPSQSIDPARTYSFTAGPWSACTQTCGGGTRTRRVACLDQLGRLVPDTSCTDLRPATSEACNTQPCTGFSWRVGAFSACSAPCGGGTQTRTVQCIDPSANVVADSNCTTPKPATSQACNTQSCGFLWVTGTFGACSAPCGGGTQTRQVSCIDATTMAPVPDSSCTTPRPSSSQTCNTQACSFRWVTGTFGSCSVACGGGTQTRSVTCVNTATMAPAPDISCIDPRPSDSQACNAQACPSYEWLADEFGPCSVLCGEGTRTRTVFCVESGTGGVVNESDCKEPKPSETTACSGPPCATGGGAGGGLPPIIGGGSGGGTQAGTMGCACQVADPAGALALLAGLALWRSARRRGVR